MFFHLHRLIAYTKVHTHIHFLFYKHTHTHIYIFVFINMQLFAIGEWKKTIDVGVSVMIDGLAVPL